MGNGKGIGKQIGGGVVPHAGGTRQSDGAGVGGSVGTGSVGTGRVGTGMVGNGMLGTAGAGDGEGAGDTGMPGGRVALGAGVSDELELGPTGCVARDPLELGDGSVGARAVDGNNWSAMTTVAIAMARRASSSTARIFIIRLPRVAASSCDGPPVERAS